MSLKKKNLQGTVSDAMQRGFVFCFFSFTHEGGVIEPASVAMIERTVHTALLLKLQSSGTGSQGVTWELIRNSGPRGPTQTTGAGILGWQDSTAWAVRTSSFLLPSRHY